MARSARPARWPLYVLALLFVALGVTALVQRGGDDGGDDEPETAFEPMEVPVDAVAGDPSPVVVARRDVVVTYRVEGYTNDGGAIVDTEQHWVRVPYESRVESVPGDDADADPTFLQIAGFGVLQTGRESEEPTVLTVEPAVAPGDVYVDVSSLEWRHEARQVLDRRCQVFRNGGPVDVELVTEPGRDSDSNAQHADLCVADDGLLLHEAWYIDGALFRVRIATAIDESPDLDDGLFEPTGARAKPTTAGVLTELTLDSQPPGVAFHELPVAPAGFAHRGRYGYSPPRVPLDVTAPEPAKVALVLDLYEDADDGRILVVANGGTSDRSPYVAGADDDTEVVDAGGLGEAVVVRGLRQNELRIGFDGGRFLRVWGTFDVAGLAEIARALTSTTDPDGQVTPK